jgi:hypothetical protein
MGALYDNIVVQIKGFEAAGYRATGLRGCGGEPLALDVGIGAS